MDRPNGANRPATKSDPESTKTTLSSRTVQNLWSPQIDITTRGGRFTVHADLPGLRLEQIKVAVNENVLTITGERSDAHQDNRDGVHRRERHYGSFRREIALPEGVDPESVQVRSENGVLEVSLLARKLSGY